MRDKLLANDYVNWDKTIPFLEKAVGETLTMVSETLLVGGLLGLLLGIALWSFRKGSILQNTVLYQILNFIINFIRPIPFIIFLTAVQPMTIAVVGTSIGTTAATFPMIIFCTVATARLVEQALITVPSGVIEAATAMGASKLRIIFDILIRETLAPLILSYAFLFVAVIDMSAMAGTIGGGGLGDYAIVYGYQKFNMTITWVCVGIIIVIVQIAQLLANFLAKKVLSR
jgi:D-methionine transport system permease protein